MYGFEDVGIVGKVVPRPTSPLSWGLPGSARSFRPSFVQSISQLCEVDLECSGNSWKVSGSRGCVVFPSVDRRLADAKPSRQLHLR